jgi:acetyltransferase-like isoleucine patch superfamily enzyme
MIKILFNLLFKNSLKVPYHIAIKFYKIWISSKKNIELEGRLILKGLPIIDIRKESKLYLGNNVTLNSSNRDYNINLYSPVKLFANRPGAEIRIGNNSRIHGTCIHAFKSIVIGEGCLIAANCQIIDGNGHDLSFPNVENRINTKGNSHPVIIEDHVWIGMNSIILPGVTIGRGSVISASSVVVKDVPPMVMAGGNPAVIKKKYSDERH